MQKRTFDHNIGVVMKMRIADLLIVRMCLLDPFLHKELPKCFMAQACLEQQIHLVLRRTLFP